ncbi:hypothetical protein [Dyadobacter sp. CY347]|uniref:hypothetical protein n=1 Tax=Dyadobacter sp. CY347 TaxID=2909336 RepID=UPI001F18D3EF|nr:hypothetical protein [Dyadobacter sp. CY347]MCF2488843.1 hypothetical protein [Dyadobacter sp. CY347]
MINKAKYLSLLVLLGAWGCTTNQYVSRSGGYDDLYGNNTGPGIVRGDQGADQDISRSDNPDYAYTGNADEGTSDYYDESYLSSRSVNRALSPDPGYNAGFADGYDRGASRFANPYGFGGLGSYWPGSMMSVGFQLGYGRIRPYMGLGMGYGMGSMMGYGYSPWGMNSMYGFGYDPFGYNGFGYSPWGYNSMYGYGYDSFYGGGYGYNPWAYSRPVVVVNNYESRGLTRTAGPRVVAGTSSRGNSRSNGSGNYVVSPRNTSGNRSGRSAANSTISANDTYVSPRSSRSGNRTGVADAGGRTAAGSSYNSSRGSSEGNNVYYSRPRASTGSNYSSDGVNTRSYNTSPRSSRGSGSSSYTAPTRSQSDYTAPSRNYSTPSRSESYTAPQRTYSQPSYSAPSRSYSAPASSGGGGGGATRSSSRGPR